uniref:RNA-binding region-containing protein 3 n=1 Tax=Panstrongylus megistus TaxID=65343 RepID=A0A069DZ25_9HEMI
MPENTTLLIRHFPPSYSKEERVEFMKTYNAVEVKCLISKYKKQSLVFAKFRTRREAEAVIKHLHQEELEDGYCLSLEFANGSDCSNFAKDFESGIERSAETKDDQSNQRRILEDFLGRLNSWSRHLDFRHPPPHHLSYQYPPPTLSVLTNIARALAAVPKFYTQVLHLMNKMSLPCPFADNYSISSDTVPDLLANLFTAFEKKPAVTSEETALPENESCEESEIESDPDAATPNIDSVGVKRMLKNKSLIKAKRLRLVKPPVQKSEKSVQLVKPEEVFEITSQNPKSEQKKIEVKVISDLNAVAATGNEIEITGEGFEKMEPQEKAQSGISESTENVNKEEDGNRGLITEEELAMNRISSRDQRMLPVFKNYQPGLPSCRLYLKNLNKNVEVADLNYIYRKFYIEQEDEQGTMFDIRLMQEGRMKGQAFITLQNEKQAEIALKETNGYILKGKPIVVQFARAKPK